MLTAERVRELLHYDPELGWFMWAVDRGPFKAGSVPGTMDERGYVRIEIDGKSYRAHQLAWLWMTGAWQSYEIDHEDRNRANNKWTNLRLATRRQQMQNAAWKPGISGIPGVHIFAGRARAVITVNRVRHYLGTFDTVEAAGIARAEKRAQLLGEA